MQQLRLTFPSTPALFQKRMRRPSGVSQGPGAAVPQALGFLLTPRCGGWHGVTLSLPLSPRRGTVLLECQWQALSPEHALQHGAGPSCSSEKLGPHYLCCLMGQWLL